MGSHRDRSCRPGGVLFWGIAGLMALAVAGCVSATAGGAATGTNAQQPATAATSLVFDGVTVVDVERGKLVPDQRVVVAGNRIRAVGSSHAVRLPKGAQVVDARGKYLIPGLWDLHTHSRRYTDFFYPLFIANGVTGIRDAASEVPLDTLIRWRRGILAGTRVGPPRQILSGPSIDEEKTCTSKLTWGGLHTCVSTPEEARHLVDSLKAAGADMIKTYGLTKAMYFVIAAEARRLGIPFGGHIEAQEITSVQASDSGASILDHVIAAGGLNLRCLGNDASVEACQPVAEHFKRNGTWWVPTLVRQVGAGPASRPIFLRLVGHAGEFWSDSSLIAYSADSLSAPPQYGPGFLRIIQRVGLPILAGTDAGAPVLRGMPPGFALHTELAMYVAEGLTPLEALQTATLNPAKFWHGTDSLGTVASGKLADLVLLDANPLANITNTTAIRAVVANGRYFDRAALDGVLAEVQAKAKQEPEPLGQARQAR